MEKNAFVDLRLLAVLTVAGFLGAISTAVGQEQKDPGSVLPLIVIDRMPLEDAIKNLARQALSGMNYILDPRMSSAAAGPDGKPVTQRLVTARWQNLTGLQALKRLLDEHGLVIREIPATTVSRITFTNSPAGVSDVSLFMNDTNEVIPLMVIESMTLGDVMKNLVLNARSSDKFVLDPRLTNLSPGAGGKIAPQPELNFRWQNLTARQALAALCENYGLVMTRDVNTGTIRIKYKD